MLKHLTRSLKENKTTFTDIDTNTYTDIDINIDRVIDTVTDTVLCFWDNSDPLWMFPNIILLIFAFFTRANTLIIVMQIGDWVKGCFLHPKSITNLFLNLSYLIVHYNMPFYQKLLLIIKVAGPFIFKMTPRQTLHQLWGLWFHSYRLRIFGIHL